MGKTVKSRTIASVASFLLVVAFCIVANSSVPKLYESYKQKVVAQQAATHSTNVIKKETPAIQEEPVAEETEAPVEETDFSEDANVYDIPEETPEEVAEPEETEEPEEDFDFDFDFDDEESEDKEESGGFFSIIMSFITSIIDKIKSLDIFAKIKDFFANILKIFGIEI